MKIIRYLIMMMGTGCAFSVLAISDMRITILKTLYGNRFINPLDKLSTPLLEAYSNIFFENLTETDFIQKREASAAQSIDLQLASIIYANLNMLLRDKSRSEYDRSKKSIADSPAEQITKQGEMKKGAPPKAPRKPALKPVSKVEVSTEKTVIKKPAEKEKSFLEEIKAGKKLKPVTERKVEPTQKEMTLLEEIKAGKKLKPVAERKVEPT